MSEKWLEESRIRARARISEPLRRALDMRYRGVGDPVEGGIGSVHQEARERENVTYRMPLGRAALSQVRFQPGKYL